jgi:hypothetical protein
VAEIQHFPGDLDALEPVRETGAALYPFAESTAPRRVGRPAGYPKTGGRPKGARNKRTVAVQEAMAPLEPKARKTLIGLLNDADPDIRFKAAQLIYAYRWGRPTERRELSGRDGAPIEQRTETIRREDPDLVAEAVARIAAAGGLRLKVPA